MELSGQSLKEKINMGSMKDVAVGSPAPDFSLMDFQDKPFTLSSFQGKKAVLLVFLRGFA